MADLVEFFCSGSAVQRSLWARLEKRVHVSEAEKKRRRTEAANAVTPLSVVDLVLLLKIPRRRYYCARFACDIARTSAHIASFSNLTARRRCVWFMPPRDRYPTLGAARERHLFGTAWAQLARERQGLFRKGLRRRDLADHLQQVCSLLPFSGKSWFRKVYGMSKVWSFPYHREGCLVYAVVNDLNGHVYGGQTGGRGHLRSTVQRFKEHMLGGINFERRKHRYDPSEWSLYEAMHKPGVHHFFIVPLEVVDKCEVDAKEQAWIAKFGGRVYNRSSDSKWRSQRNIKRFFQTPRPLPRGDLKVLANRYVQMRSPPLPEMLNLWTRSENRLPQALRRSLWDRLIAVARDTRGIKLPRRLVFPHPPCDPTELQDLRMLV